MSLRWTPIASGAIGDDICHSLLQQERLKSVGGAVKYTAINYGFTVRFVGDNHRKRRRAPPIQSEVAGDYSQTLNLNLNLQSHTESCD